MEHIEGNTAARTINDYIEREVSEFKRTTENEHAGSVTPEAKAAFARKPYYKVMGTKLKSRPVLR